MIRDYLNCNDMVEDVFTEEEDLIDRTWKKHERSLQKDGFREGALKGREDSFQNGFNIGYCEGFKMGETLGIYKGILSSCKQLNLSNPNLLKYQKHLDENEMDKACVLCKDRNFSLDLNSIVEEQKKKNDAIINESS